MDSDETSVKRIAAIILAAGNSSRMGSPKAALRSGDLSFIQRIINTLRVAHVESIIVVIGSHAEIVRKEIAGFDIEVVENAAWQKGQLSSIQRGIEVAAGKGIDGVLIFPVDHPAVRPATVSALVARYRSEGGKILVPVCSGRRGHPALFDREVFGEIMDASPDGGARSVVRRHFTDTIEVPTEDSGVVRDIDTMEEYEEYLASL